MNKFEEAIQIAKGKLTFLDESKYSQQRLIEELHKRRYMVCKINASLEIR
jgi:hypothetical protein